jgi:hypothetical protein
MNKKILLTILFLSLISGGVVFARHSFPTSSIKEKKEIVKTQAKEIKEKLKNQKEDIKNKIENKKEKILKSFEVAIKNLESLLVRINSRISKIEASSVDMSKIKILVASSTNAISLAKIEYNKLADMIPENMSTSTSERKVLLEKIKTQSENTKIAIKNAHASVVNIITSLKVGLEKNKWQNSTSTATTTED